MAKEIYLVCGTIRAFDASEAVCFKCSAIIWPTAGSLRRAQLEHVQLICIDCYAKIKDYAFGGVMHHGVLLPNQYAEAFLCEFERTVGRKKAD